jgi:hypothetical protein
LEGLFNAELRRFVPNTLPPQPSDSAQRVGCSRVVAKVLPQHLDGLTNL